ncbi:MAG: NAD(P)H-dependent oxidoreductase [Oscillospiraceae bacterium]|nr:NAD(P)H-dependent oxidoreductase [Oscillospiraceae bacterium]
MKCIVVYYSLEGNTEYAAQKIAEITGAELLRLEPVKEYPATGFRKFFWGGKSAVMGEAPDLEPYTFHSEEYDCVIIGFPVWAGTITPPIRTFIRDHALHAKKIAAFACESGAGGEKALEKLRSMIGIDEFSTEMVLVDPKTKPSQENEEKIRAFCSQLVI